ncbi:hypothetical protein KIH86_25895 [Paenibacillus sp. HN-1]|uniref:hypothetical protein n=1 Tax=Paenibacillus TaxID=44249 RepID=UPI001CA9E957|nr:MULTISPECIES: hypothetical protein [Paenibacillus]MBY9078911.1 hypothetical protein [Paenibacillus sp. CGMCC 1.18879]MBY9087624.1 hypothetical protein [Paenibacillus sinensis]
MESSTIWDLARKLENQLVGAYCRGIVNYLSACAQAGEPAFVPGAEESSGIWHVARKLKYHHGCLKKMSAL